MPDATLPPRFQHPGGRARAGGARPRPHRAGLRRAPRWGCGPPRARSRPRSSNPRAAGVKWCATDQGNLERSERAVEGNHYQPWMCGAVAMFFRDREMSDLIAPLRARRAAGLGGRSAPAHRRGGRGCNRHHPRSTARTPGSTTRSRASCSSRRSTRGSRKARSLHPAAQRDLRAPAQGAHHALAQRELDRLQLPHLDRHPEDNQAWELLGQARAALQRAPASPEREKAYQACLAAEGSDWFWWYGDDFTTENAPEFDALFRRNVAQVFRRLGLAEPERSASRSSRRTRTAPRRRRSLRTRGGSSGRSSTASPAATTSGRAPGSTAPA